MRTKLLLAYLEFYARHFGALGFRSALLRMKSKKRPAALQEFLSATIDILLAHR